jgi:hypothetical protein
MCRCAQRNALVDVIEAYFDESGTHLQSPSMCVAGYLFTAQKAKRFQDRWGSILRQAGLEYFRMSECAPGAGQFKGWLPKHRQAIEKELIKAIREHVTHGVAVWVSRDEFRLRAPSWWQRYYGGPYTACLMQCVILVAVWAKKTEQAEPISYFFEAGDPKAGEAGEHMRKTASHADEAAAAHYAGHSFIPKKTARQFDAADALAWNLNRTYIDGTNKGLDVEQAMRPAWRKLLLADEAYTVYSLRREQLKRFFESQKPPEVKDTNAGG